MTNAEMEAQIVTCAASLRTLVDALCESEPNIEQSVALGSLSAALLILDTLASLPADRASAELIAAFLKWDAS